MKLVTFVPTAGESTPRVGAWLDGDIVDIGAALLASGADRAGVPDSLRSMLALGANGLALAQRGIEHARRLAVDDRVRWSRGAVRLLPPVPDPHLFFCVGKNNKSHLDELVRNQLIKEIPKEPTGFVKLNSAMVGDRASVARPMGITTLDYEPEPTLF